APADSQRAPTIMDNVTSFASIRRSRVFLLIGVIAGLYLLLLILVGPSDGQVLSPWRLVLQWSLLFLLPWLLLLPLVSTVLDKVDGSPQATRQRMLVLSGGLLLRVHVALAGTALWFAPNLAISGLAGNSWFAAASLMVNEGFVLFDAAIMIALAAAH